MGEIFGCSRVGKAERLTEGHEQYGDPPAETKVKHEDSSAVLVAQSNASVSPNHGEGLAYAECTRWQRSAGSDD